LNAACSLHFAVVPSPTCFIVAEMVGLLLLSPLLSYSKKPIPVRVAGGQCVRLVARCDRSSCWSAAGARLAVAHRAASSTGSLWALAFAASPLVAHRASGECARSRLG